MWISCHFDELDIRPHDISRISRMAEKIRLKTSTDNNHKHLNTEDWEDIQTGLDQGLTFKEIDHYLHRDPGTISKEVKRNRVCKGSTFNNPPNNCQSAKLIPSITIIAGFLLSRWIKSETWCNMTGWPTSADEASTAYFCAIQVRNSLSTVSYIFWKSSTINPLSLNRGCQQFCRQFAKLPVLTSLLSLRSMFWDILSVTFSQVFSEFSSHYRSRIYTQTRPP